MTDFDYLDLTQSLSQAGCSAGYLAEKAENLPDIPELTSAWADVCLKGLRAVKEFVLVESKKIDPVDADSIIKRALRMTFFLCEYAGIGAVYYWDLDPDALKRKGIFETLKEPKGVIEMDEAIVDAIGLPFQSPREKALREHLYEEANNMLFVTLKCKDKQEQAVECMHALYLYGILLGTVLLGL